MNRKRYLFFDIDGTLLAGGYHDTYIGFTNMVSDGGYGITIDDKFYGAIPLPGEPVVRLIAECVALSMPWAIQTDNTVYRTAPDSRFEDFTHDPYMKTRVVPGLDPRSFDKIYKAYIACLPGEEQKLETLRELPWCRYHNEYFFVEPTDKSVGIKQILDRLGADYSDAIVFGDALNDMSMFKTTASITPASPWASSEALFLFSHRAHTAALLFHIIDIPFILHVFPSSFSSIPLSFSLYWRNFRQ